MSDILENIIGVEEASELWDLSPGYIKNLCAEGEIKARKIGKTWIIDKRQPSPSKKASEPVKYSPEYEFPYSTPTEELVGQLEFEDAKELRKQAERFYSFAIETKDVYSKIRGEINWEEMKKPIHEHSHELIRAQEKLALLKNLSKFLNPAAIKLNRISQRMK